MPTKFRSIFKIAIVATAIGGAYVAGAMTSNEQNVMRLNQSVDVLTKAKAILSSVESRQSYGAVEKAKSKIDGALQDIDTAIKQNGG